MKHIYLFSGLGADYRAFEFIDLADNLITHIQWLRPDRKESLADYAKRLSKQITADNSIFIGLSFGGIVAVEVANFVKPEKIILISSMKSSKELPLHFKVTAWLRLHKTMSSKALKKPNKVLFWLFGVSHQKEKALLTEIIKDTDPYFLKWAIDKIMNWRNEIQHQNLTHIHGTADRIIPSRKIINQKSIEGGGHFMIVNRASEISKVIRDIL